jgi:alcohol dehydrogenase class IV
MSVMAVADPSTGGNPVELTVEAAKKLFHESI